MKNIREKLNYPKVSVLVITYNQIDFISNTIESVINQDYPNFEYIISDDGSTDGTAEVIKQYEEKYPDIITAIYGDNIGITNNSNRGLRLCTGEFIAIQGGDDVFYPGKIKKQVLWLLEDSKNVLCGHRLDLINFKGERFGEYKTQLISGKGNKNWIEKGPLYGATSVMLRSEYIPKFGFDERLPLVSDWKLYIDTLKDNGRYGYINEVLGGYRKHENNITNVKEPVMKDAERTLDIVRCEFPGNNKSIRKGIAYIIYYGRGLNSFQVGEFDKALFLYLKSILKWPFSIKPYFRIFELIFFYIKRKD